MTDQTVPQDSRGTPAEKLELDQQGFSQYLLYSRSEILFVLRQILQKRSMITVYFNAGKSFFLTTLIAVSDDGNWIYIDMPSDAEAGRGVLGAKKLMLTTMLDKVKIQFSIEGVQEVASGNGKSLAGHPPETLLRLQRRQHFRLSTPVAHPLRCVVEQPDANGGRTGLELTLLDISGGGVGLMVTEAEATQFPPGSTFPNCHIDIPEEGTITTGLCVRNAFSVTAKSGHPHWRVGCEFIEIAGHQLTMVQRYITRIERDRKARDAGLS